MLSQGSTPSDVQITIIADASARPLGERIAHISTRRRGLVLAGIVLILATAGALLLGVPGIRSRTSIRGAPTVAAAYGFAPRCLAVTVSHSDPSYARADFNHRNACGEFDGYATAIFHRVDGGWRPVLEALSYLCPVASLPRSVQVEFGVCP